MEVSVGNTWYTVPYECLLCISIKWTVLESIMKEHLVYSNHFFN